MQNRTRQNLTIGAALAAVVILAALVRGRIAEYRRIQAVPILMYHHIWNIDNSAWCVPPDVFERQMKFLRDRGYTSILPADLAAHQRWGSPLPSRPVIVTLDDGYLDSLTVAEPILRKYGLRGIVYLMTDSIGAVPDQRGRLEGADCLTWSEVRAMQARGTLTFGGHSHAHRNLAVAPNPLFLARECYRQIFRNGGFIPDSFSYPFGQYNERAVDAVRYAGFGTALACKDAVARTEPNLNLLALPRVSVMGGRHRFIVTRARDRESAGEVVFHVRHEGIPIEVTPRLKGITGDTWLSARELRHGAEVEWRWTLKTPSDRDKPLALEIWDKNRILLLYPACHSGAFL